MVPDYLEPGQTVLFWPIKNKIKFATEISDSVITENRKVTIQVENKLKEKIILNKHLKIGKITTEFTNEQKRNTISKQIIKQENQKNKFVFNLTIEDIRN